MDQSYTFSRLEIPSAKCRALLTILLLCTQVVFLQPAVAETIPLNGTLSTQDSQEAWPSELSINVTGPSQSRNGTIVRAAFIAELESRGYVIDIAASMDGDLSWGGDFETSSTKESRVTLQGEGGNRTAPSLGLSLKLGMPKGADTDFTYVLECQIFSSSGFLWKGKTVARTQSNDVQKIARALSDELISAFGETHDEKAFSSNLTIR